MPAFSYKAKDRKGEIVTGTLDAESRGAVNGRLQAMGYFPISISGGEGGGISTSSARAGTKPMRAKSGNGGWLAGWLAKKPGTVGRGAPKPAGAAIKKTAARPAAKMAGRTAVREAVRRDAKPGGEGNFLTRKRGGRVRNTDLSEFYRQMADLIGAGVPLVKALAIVKGQTTHPTMLTVLGQVNSDVQAGDTFAAALERHATIFNKLNCALVRAGETGGLLDQTLGRIADFAESQDELRSKIKGALAYPLIMVLVGVTAVAVLLTYVMPKVLVIFKDLNQTLPVPTQILIHVSDFLQSYWLILAVALAIGYFLFRRFVATEHGQYRYHLLLLRIPKFGELILKREIAGFARTLGSLLRNGVPILNALSIASEVMTIRPIRSEIDKIPDSITQGAGMAASLRTSPLFPSVVVNMVAIGEETGQLPDVLMRVASSYESQVERDIKLLTSFIEPVIILMLGLVVGAIVISMLLPIFSLDPTAGT
jgi:type II secretory pathway component PulF